MHRTLVALICLATTFPSIAQAGDSMKKALAVVPGDAVGFVCVANLKELDGKWQQGVANFGLAPFVSQPWNSPIALLKQFMRMTEGLDVNGPVIVVLMPFDDLVQMNKRSAIIFPADKPKALVEAMGGVPGEEGAWTLTIFGKPSFAITGEKRLIVSDRLEGAKAAAESKEMMDAKLKGKKAKAFDGLDVVFWLDGQRLLKVFKPQIETLLAMATMGPNANDPFLAKQMESTKAWIDMFMEGAESAMLGLALDPAGVGIRLGMQTKTGSKLARQMKMKPIKGSLMKGLPAGKFMLAGGEVWDSDALKESLKQMDPYWEMGEEVESIDSEQLGKLKGIVEDCALSLRGMSVSMEALPAGPHGVIGMSLLLDTSDNKQWFELMGKAVEALKSLSTDEDAKEVSNAATYTPEAEEIGGVQVAQFKLDVSKLEELDEDELEDFTTVVGKEGLLFRFAPVGANTVAVTFGGGPDYMKRLIQQAGKDAAPLQETPGIQKVVGHLPKKRAAELYIAVDQILACVGNAVKALDEDDEFPFRMPNLKAPVAISKTEAGGAVQVDIFIPTELLAASKEQVLMGMMGGGGGMPGQPPPPPAPAEGAQ